MEVPNRKQCIVCACVTDLFYLTRGLCLTISKNKNLTMQVSGKVLLRKSKEQSSHTCATAGRGPKERVDTRWSFSNGLCSCKKKVQTKALVLIGWQPFKLAFLGQPGICNDLLMCVALSGLRSHVIQ
jgi:hypothetical protein